MKVSEPHALLGQTVEIRRTDLSSIATYIGEAQVIGDNHEEIGAFGGHGGMIQPEVKDLHTRPAASGREGREGYLSDGSGQSLPRTMAIGNRLVARGIGTMGEGGPARLAPIR